MKTIREVMSADVVWVSPTARVKTAVILMKGHSISALPVVHNNDQVVGLVCLRDLLGEDPDAAVSDVMETNYPTIAPEATIQDAAGEMSKTRRSHLVVTAEDGRLAGIVSQSDILPELGKHLDPLTGLPYSDAFREWATNALKQGVEISVIFFDLDKFGAFNKNHGHVVGDTVLKEVAEVFKKTIDPEIEFPCRYGGEEFAVVSTRRADEALALADRIKEGISRIRIPEVPEGISGTYGISGGRRTREREDIHFASTIDDLITRASKECTAKKRAARSQQETPPEEAAKPVAPAPSQPQTHSAARLCIQSISLTMTGAEAGIRVLLARGSRNYEQEVHGYAVGGKNILRLVAEAAAGAACKSLASGHGVVVDEVLVYETGADEQVITTVCTFVSPRISVRTVGSAVVRHGDQYRAAAAAILDALNRQLEFSPQAVLDDQAQSDQASA
jgi:IMP dehydrogenase